MRDVCHHLQRTLVLQCLRTGGQRTRGVHHVVDEYAGLALDLTDDVHHFRLVRPRSALVDDRQVRIVEALRERSRAYHATDVRRHHDHVLVALPVRIT